MECLLLISAQHISDSNIHSRYSNKYSVWLLLKPKQLGDSVWNAKASASQL
jgi:hypothetical protein